MSTNASVNLDARWLRDLASELRDMPAEEFSYMSRDKNEVLAHLQAIADNIDRMDEKLMRLNDYDWGWRDGRAIQHSKSNVLTSHEITPSDGQIIAQALANGRVTRVPRGVSGLPPEAPVKPKAPKAPKEPLIHIDLKGL